MSPEERALEWRSERSLDPQLSTGFRTLYSLFAWLTLDAQIAPCWLFLVFSKVGRTPRERLREHMVRAADGRAADHNEPHQPNPLLHFIPLLLFAP